MSARYTVVTGPAVTEALAPGALADVVDVKLPEELEAGKWITGEIHVKNIGDARGKIASLLHTLWDDKFYGGWLEVDPGVTVKFMLEEGLIEMPEEDALIEIYGGVLLDGWDKFRQDDATSWTVKLYVPPVWPWWWPIAAVGGGATLIAVVGAVAMEERRKETELMMLMARR